MRLGSPRLTATVLLVLGAMRTCAWLLDPTPHLQSLLPALVVPVLWGYVELVGRSDTAPGREMLGVLRSIFAVFGLFLVARTCLAIAFDVGALPVTAVPLARRAVGAGFGALVVSYGNHLPKITSPWTLEEEPFDWQRVHRTVGWLAVMSGVVVTAGWLWLPLAQASRLQTGTIIGCAVLGVSVKFASVIARGRRGRSAAWMLLIGSLISSTAVNAQTATEVRYPSGDGTILAGTLTLPDGDGPFPAVLLISGAGAQDRDYTALGHRFFLAGLRPRAARRSGSRARRAAPAPSTRARPGRQTRPRRREA